MSVLSVQALTMRFGGLTAVNKVDFEVSKGEIFSVIGPNGAGKTTLFNAITGVYAPTEGKILFEGRDLKLPLSLRTVLLFLITGLYTGFGLTLLINAQSLWEAVISANYVYRTPFPWIKAISDFAHFFAGSPLSYSALPMCLGLIVGSLGAYSSWRRSRRTPDVIADSGITRTFQNIRLFKEMSVLENILVGMDSRLSSTFLDAIFRLPRERREYRTAVEKAFELLKFVELENYADLPARNLSYGHQRRLEIARGLASEPRLILLDEPAAGMNPSESKDLMDLIMKIRARGVTVILIEHHMNVVMGISDRIVVLDYGNRIALGTPQEIRADPKVIEAYLGKDIAHE